MDYSKLALIIKTIDEYLEKSGDSYITAVDAAAILDRKGILKDSESRPGKPLRDILRTGLIPHAYQVGVFWRIPHSGSCKKQSLTKFELTDEEQSPPSKDQIETGHKLAPIAILLSQILEKKYNRKVDFSIEYSPNWLTSVPRKEELAQYWSIIQQVYSSIVDGKYILEKRIELVERNRTQNFDIWFHKPFSFALEFDESQHFNQFRFQTLDFYAAFPNALNISDYLLFNQTIKKPGKSGFQKLRSYDPLFPELSKGEGQDNRIRQRAFRDFLKDIIPIAKGFNPTLRIPYQVVNGKISNFNTGDLELIRQYIYDNELLNNIKVL